MRSASHATSWYESPMGKPELGRPIGTPILARPTEFEIMVRRLQLTPELHAASRELRRWGQLNRNRCYIPEGCLRNGAWMSRSATATTPLKHSSATLTFNNSETGC